LPLTDRQKLAIGLGATIAVIAGVALAYAKPPVPSACAGYEQYLADGSLIKVGPLYEAPYEVYKMEGGKKRWIPDMNIFASCGFALPDVHILPQACVDSIPRGADVTSCGDVRCKYPLTNCGTEAQPRACDASDCYNRYGSPEPGYYWTYANGCCIKTPYSVGCYVRDYTDYATGYGHIPSEYLSTKPNARLNLKVNIPPEIWNAAGGPWIHTVYASTIYRYPAYEVTGHGFVGWQGWIYDWPTFDKWKDGQVCLILNPTVHKVKDALTGVEYPSPTYTVAPPIKTHKTVPGWAGGMGGYYATLSRTYLFDGTPYEYPYKVSQGGVDEYESREFALEPNSEHTFQINYDVKVCKTLGEPECLEWGYRKVCLGYGQTCTNWECLSRDATGKCTNWHCAGEWKRECIQWGTEKYCVRYGGRKLICE
jgi:hypothetical protein